MEMGEGGTERKKHDVKKNSRNARGGELDEGKENERANEENRRVQRGHLQGLLPYLALGRHLCLISKMRRTWTAACPEVTRSLKQTLFLLRSHALSA